ncbi:hypothetical protein DYBT9275_01030 [Dyadobacter sp. CECT 9275]|uniref:DUF2490 domain-containing protein n=1 Tax=Dyadobacter helix TaxID=2822344 RepID=A0A916NK42_9BACT|nr:DUF2490 domain-containing protein [Dyadobacter sp. CECT 9275]CAG4992760.1 hypothetical protein DYBT9275_01030 [Dyadobacter sp. CECT 9275]
MKSFLIAILICMPFLGNTQGIGLWTSAHVEKKLNKSFSVNVSGQTRFSDNANVLKSYLGEAGLEYKLNKYFGASLYYRYIGKRKQDKSSEDYYYRSFHRFYGNVTFEYKLTKWLKFDYRFRYQDQFKDDESGLINSGSYFRHKAEFTYKNKSRFSPYVSVDVFYLLGTGFEQIRYKTGCNISLNKRNSFDLSVFADKAVVGGATDPAVISLAYKLKMK